MNDDLDTKTDAQISEIFAVEVAGWVKDKDAPDGENLAGYPISYATSADAVMPWLGKEQFGADNYDRMFHVVIFTANRARGYIGKAQSFPRAACIALIRVKRAEKGDAK